MSGGSGDARGRSVLDGQGIPGNEFLPQVGRDNSPELGGPAPIPVKDDFYNPHVRDEYFKTGVPTKPLSWGTVKYPATDTSEKAHADYWAAIGRCEIKRLASHPDLDAPIPFVPTTPFRQDMLAIAEDEFEEVVYDLFGEAGDLLLQKHEDYGPLNISKSPGGPLNGLRVRIWDKLARINNLVDNGAEPQNESLRDSFLDMLNYSAIALMVLDGNWPEGE